MPRIPLKVEETRYAFVDSRLTVASLSTKATAEFPSLLSVDDVRMTVTASSKGGTSDCPSCGNS